MKAARAVVAITSLSTIASLALAQPSGSASSKAVAAPSASSIASAATSTSASSSASVGPIPSTGELPPGHPPVAGGNDVEGPLPPGHPSTGPAQEAPIGPDGKPLRRLPEDDSSEDPSLPIGTLRLQVRDADDKPLARQQVAFTVTRQSIAEGDTKNKQAATTDENGFIEWKGLSTGTGWSYRIDISATASDDPSATAIYSLPPIMLPLDKGWRAALHVFPVTTNIERVAAGVESVDTIVEVRDDVVEVTQIFELANYSPMAWSFGKGLVLALPKGAKALRGQDSGQDFRIATEDAGQGAIAAKWLGSVSPGRLRIAYDFKLPYDGEPSLAFDIELPPHTVAARVRTPARKEMSLAVEGFPNAHEEPASTGVRILSTVKQATSLADTLHVLKVRIDGLPTPGTLRLWAVGACAVLFVAGLGLLFGIKGDGRDEAAIARAKAKRREQLLEDLRLLDRAHRSGEVGPKAYERERASLVDALADVIG